MELRVFLRIKPTICGMCCRLGTGDVVEIFDGDGNGYIGEVDFQDSGVYVRGLQQHRHPMNRKFA